MIKKILLLAGVVLLITGCGNLELKKSASNKLFDSKGFDGAKRKPIYNGKYIDRAKRNVVENNYEEDNFDMDEPDEFVDPYTQNRIMYSNMVKNEKSGKRSGQRRNKNTRAEPYPNIGHARDIASAENKDDANAELRRELSEIRAILSSTKKDLAKYKCPLQDAYKEPLSNAPIHKKPIKKPIPVKHESMKHEVVKDVEEGYDDDADVLPHATTHKKRINESHDNAIEAIHKSDEAEAASHPQEQHVSEPIVDSHKITPAAPVNESVAPAPLSSTPAVVPPPVAPIPAEQAPAQKVVEPAPKPQPPEHKMMNLAPVR